MKRKVNCCELPLEKILIGLPHIVKAASETWPNSLVKVNSTLTRSFKQKTLLRTGHNAQRQFCALQHKDQLIDLRSYLNQKITTAINTLDGSTLGDNLILSYQVDYVSSVLIPAEAVENI